MFWLQTPRETKNLKIGAHHLNAVCSHNLLTEVADPGIELNEDMYVPSPSAPERGSRRRKIYLNHNCASSSFPDSLFQEYGV